jgi:outer membrane protein OmpA-like peptidoglycan-associated protein
MKRSLLVALAAVAGGCATTSYSGPTSSLPMCMPCTNPCFPIPECSGAKAAAPAPKPAPAPVPAPAPAPAPVAPAAAPTFDPGSGTFAGAQSVRISSATPGAVIHCTTDGSEPTAASPVCSGPVAVDKTTTVRALAVAPGAPPSAASSATYTVAPPPPPAAPAKVVVTKDKLELREKVFFDTAKTSIKKESLPLLDEVAQVLKDHPEVAKVAIEGHTDNVGKPATNLKLSQGRAESVKKYLVGKGVAADRLLPKGYGETKPVADNATAKGREANRRVDFIVAQ